MSAAYRKLSDEGLVRRIGKRYWVGPLMPALPPSVRREVWIAVARPSDLPHIYTDDRMAEAYQKLERELRASGFLLRYTSRPELEGLQRQWAARETAVT